jgi:hypothetical protein
MQDTEWVVLKEWSGETGTTVTEKFTTTERVFRVSWSSSELDRGGLLDVYVWSEAKRLIMLSAGRCRITSRKLRPARSSSTPLPVSITSRCAARV